MIVHGTCVALEGRGLLIVGASGSGKSGLGLQLMAFGARLVADDRVELTLVDATVQAAAPRSLPPLIEARGVGLLQADPLANAPLVAVVDLDQTEDARLPKSYRTAYLGIMVPLLRGCGSVHFAASLVQLLRRGRHTP